MSVFTPPHPLDCRRWSGLRVGLLGGSFNPPHKGHLHISLAALSGLHLDAVWWLVTPQNPLKAGIIEPLPLEKRMTLCRNLVRHPKILISAVEKDLGTTMTYCTIRQLKTRFPKTQFVWISGMDNALTLHRWNHWQALLREICMVHLTRAPAVSLIQSCPLRLYGPQRHRVIDKGGRYPLDSGTTYWLLQKKIVNVSSTALREIARQPAGNPAFLSTGADGNPLI